MGACNGVPVEQDAEARQRLNGINAAGAARSYRVPPGAPAESYHHLKGYAERSSQSKLNIIDEGMVMAKDKDNAQPALPERRKYQDVPFAVLFMLMCIGVAGIAVWGITGGALKSFARKMQAGMAEDAYSSEAHKSTSDDVKMPPLPLMAGAGASGLVAAVIMAWAFAYMAKRASTCVVWTSLTLGPGIMILMGLGCLLSGLEELIVMAVILFCMAFLALTCVVCCYKRLIPFTALVVKHVAAILWENPAMIVLSLFAGMLSIAWNGLVAVAVVSLWQVFESDKQHSRSESGLPPWLEYSGIFATAWGSSVVYSVCHTTYCGVFARSLYQAGHGRTAQTMSPFLSSFLVATTTSFGSICFGTLLTAILTTMEAMARNAKESAQKDNNLAACVIGCVIECVISCIGDILEYFNEWSYVQCAIRGVSFIESAKITFGLMTSAHVPYILSDLLINSVVNLGALLCGLVGCIAGGLPGLVLHNLELGILGAMAGLFGGLMVGGTAVGILGSGTKTFLVMWADDETLLDSRARELHDKFHTTVDEKYQAEQKALAGEGAEGNNNVAQAAAPAPRSASPQGQHGGTSP